MGEVQLQESAIDRSFELNARGESSRISNSGESGELRPSERALLWLSCGLVFTVPLVMGGKEPIIFFAAQFTLAIVAIAICGEALFGPRIRADARTSLWHSKVARRTIPLVLFGLGAIAFQLLPLPLFLLDLLSWNSAESYRVVNAGTATISLEADATRGALLWIVALLALPAVLLTLPRDFMTLHRESGRRSKHQSETFRAFVRQASEVDRPIYLLCNTIIASGLLCGFIAISHWAIRSESYFGIWEGSSGGANVARAHWPFVNPDHLAVYLEIALVLSWTKFLHRLQIHQLRSVGWIDSRAKDRGEKSAQQAIADLGWNGVVVFLLFISVFLTVSRAGMALAVCGLIGLWFYQLIQHRRFVVPQHAASTARKRKSPSKLRFLGRRSIPLLFFSLVVLLAFVMLGGSGREIVASRIEYGLVQGYDSVRATLSAVTWEVFLSSPLVGIGVGCWSLVAPRFSPPMLSGWTLDFAHNDPLQLLSEVGIIGFAPWILFGLVVTHQVLKAIKFTDNPGLSLQVVGLALACILPLIHSCVDFPFHIPGIAVAFIAVVSALVRLLALSETKSEAPVILVR